MVGERVPKEVVEKIKMDLGEDRPVIIQYIGYLGLILKGELGRSYYTDRAIAEDILEKLPNTFKLALAATLFATVARIILGVVSAAYISRITRFSMLEVLSRPCIETARAKGLSEFSVIMKHALRNALIPIVTLIGIDFGSYLNGSVLTETIFGWDGEIRLELDHEEGLPCDNGDCPCWSCSVCSYKSVGGYLVFLSGSKDQERTQDITFSGYWGKFVIKKKPSESPPAKPEASRAL